MPKTEEEQKKIDRLNKHRHKTYKKYYEPWKKNPVYCPYLKCEVFATKNGWEHTAGINKFRTIEDTHRRLDLFKYARDIVEKSGTCQYIRYQNDSINFTFEASVEFKGEFEESRKLKRVKVVVIKKADGVCFYHSVMD